MTLPARPRLSRRALVTASLLAASPLHGREAPARAYRTLEVSAPAGRSPRRALVLLPSLPAPRELPVLVLLHGLGETRSQQAGVRAWLDPYGLGEAWQTLAGPALAATAPKEMAQADWDAHLRVHAERPFLGLCVVCPFMPNPYEGNPADPRCEAYAKWLCDALLPAVRERLPEATRERAHTGVAGVSLGGIAALEVYLRRPEAFGTVGTVQGAFSAERARFYARELARSTTPEPPALYVATSKFDPYRAANLLLAQEAAALGVLTSACSRAGAHNQDWLRKVGSLELLAYHDRALRRTTTRGAFRWEPCSAG